MAVYTQVTAEDLDAFLRRYELGEALSFKGIAEGVSNSNYLLDTTRGRFILTLYERRIDVGELPWFLSLMTHLADAGLPVPRPIPDRSGTALQTLNTRPACLIEFLPGVSVTHPTPDDCEEAGKALARLHRATASFATPRPNSLGPESWPPLAEKCAPRLHEIDATLPALIVAGLAAVTDWPQHLPQGTIHADLFPDNVLLQSHKVSGLIDFYFACTDTLAYDYAITHAAWCFTADGTHQSAHAAALAQGYTSIRPFSQAEQAALPRLGTGAAMRFTLTRAYDWLNTPADALVTRKDPMAFARRLGWYMAATPTQLLGA
jgi:homoserine kinase type II